MIEEPLFLVIFFFFFCCDWRFEGDRDLALLALSGVDGPDLDDRRFIMASALLL